MPDNFGFPVNQNLWVPLGIGDVPLKRGEGPQLSIFGRLAEGAGLDAAQAELSTVTARAAAADPASNQHLRPEVKPYVPSLVSALDVGTQVRALYMANLVFVALPGVLVVGSVAAESGRNGLADGIAVAAAVATFVMTIAAAACSVPLRRALRIQPTEALRE